jgi:gamma-glutamylcyclotransferase (GGCT)/AIG2-like uncharacterized protein YtfP
VLYFAYTTLIDPDHMEKASPDATFEFVAHLPETKLIFPVKDTEWKGGLPSVLAEAGNTVWGAIFEVPKKDLSALDEVEGAEGRVRVIRSAMDRAGKRHEVVTHAFEPNGKKAYKPSSQYMSVVVKGGRHWSLPAGWIMGLEEYV